MGTGWSNDHGPGITKKELERMQRRFQRLARGTSRVALSDFETLPELQNNPFTRRIFELFDTNADGYLELTEFTSAVQQLSSMHNVEDRHHFMFQLYDLDRNGYVSRDELFFILRTLMGHAVSENHLDKVVDATIVHYDHDGDGQLGLDEFREMIAGSGAVAAASG